MNRLPGRWRAAAHSPLLIATALLSAAPAAAQLPAGQLCAPTLGAVPTIDGEMAAGATTSETGWSGAATVVLDDIQGTTNPQGVIRVGSTSTDVYIGGAFDQIYVEEGGSGATTAADNSTIVLAFAVKKADGTTGTLRRFVIHPFKFSENAATSLTNLSLAGDAERLAYYWTSDGAWTSGDKPAVPDTAWLKQPGNFKFARTLNRWSFEMKIPRSTSGDPTAVDFGGPGETLLFYASALSTRALGDTSDFSYQQYTFPQSAPLTDGARDVSVIMPALSAWGKVKLDATGPCGISLTADNIGVWYGGAIQGLLRRPADITSSTDCTGLSSPTGMFTNEMIARVRSTQPAPANVTATFSVSQFGINWNNWTVLSPAPAVVNPGSSTDIKYNWTQTRKDICDLFKAWDHQCFKVELTSSDGTVLTANTQRNLYWATASEFSHKAILDLKGLPPGKQRIVLRVHNEVLEEQETETDDTPPPMCDLADPLSRRPVCDCLKTSEVLTGRVDARKFEAAISCLEPALCKSHPDVCACLDPLKDGYGKLKPKLPPDGHVPDLDDLIHGGLPPCFNKLRAALRSSQTDPLDRYETLRRSVHAYWVKDSAITIKGKKHNEEKYLGSYEYLVRHFLPAGPAKPDEKPLVWNHKMAIPGQDMKPRGNGGSAIARKSPGVREIGGVQEYTISVNGGEQVPIDTQIATMEGDTQIEPCDPRVQCCCRNPGMGGTTGSLNFNLPIAVAAAFVSALGARRRGRERRRDEDKG